MTKGSSGSSCTDEEMECEVRPGGMLVQKRSDCCPATVLLPNIRVRVAYAAVRHEISVIPQETVGGLKKSIEKGHKVPEVQITMLIEMLMRQAVKLDKILAKGEAVSSKNSQGKRAQSCVEKLDVLKVSNAKIKPVVIMMTWETFDISPTRPSNPRMTDPRELFD